MSEKTENILNIVQKILISLVSAINFTMYAQQKHPMQLLFGIFLCFMFIWHVSIDIRRGMK